MRADHGPPARGLGRPAAGLELALVLATGVLVAALGLPADIGRDDWLAFAALLPLVIAAHLLGADRARHQGSHLSLAPIFAAVLILPPALAVGLVALAFVPEWLRSRAEWYIVFFNVCNFVAPALVARAVFDTLGEVGPAEWALGAAAAIGAFLTLHYALLASVLRLARGVRVRDTVRLDCLLIDAGLLSLGAIAAALWEDQPALVALTVVPLALAYRSLSSPALVEAPGSSPRPASSTSGTSALRSRRSSGARRASTARWRCSWSTSTASGRSTRRAGTWRATGRSSPSPKRSGRPSGTTTSPPASAGTSSASCCPRPSSRAPSSSPSGSGPSSRRPAPRSCASRSRWAPWRTAAAA